MSGLGRARAKHCLRLYGFFVFPEGANTTHALRRRGSWPPIARSPSHPRSSHAQPTTFPRLSCALHVRPANMSAIRLAIAYISQSWSETGGQDHNLEVLDALLPLQRVAPLVLGDLQGLETPAPELGDLRRDPAGQTGRHPDDGEASGRLLMAGRRGAARWGGPSTAGKTSSLTGTSFTSSALAASGSPHVGARRGSADAGGLR